MVIPVPDAHMTMMILTGLHLVTPKQITCREIEPAGRCLHQLIAIDRKTIHVAAAGQRIPGMRERRDGGS